MNRQLNIKSSKTHALASQLATLTGESLIEAVTTAIQERLDRELRARNKAEKIARIRELARDIRAHLREPMTSADHAELYDDVSGLPK